MSAPYADAPPTDDSAKLIRWARIGLTIVLALLARTAFRDEYGNIPLISDIDLAVHEFGHMLFMPFGIQIFGGTATILGGSLTQVAFPLVFMAYFLWTREKKRRDVHAAMVCLWWTSINLLDVSIYCADSRAGKLMLITGQTGQESDGHDWYNLLFHWGLLERDTVIAARMRAVAVLLCFFSLAIGLYAALQQAPAAESAEESSSLRSSEEAS